MVNQEFATLLKPDLVTIRERHIGRLTRLFAGEDDKDTAFVLYGEQRRLDGTRIQDPRVEVGNILRELASQADSLRDELVFRPLALECDIYGVHFVDKIFGADVFDLDGSWQVRLLKQSVGNLASPDLDRNATWRKAQEIAKAFLDASVTVPFFSLPTIASALNVGVNLYGQELLAAMLADSEAVHHDLGVINQTLRAIHRWYRKILPPSQLQPVVGASRTQPPGFGQLCGCTTQLLSEQQYRVFVASLDAGLLGEYPHGGMIHLCGSHLQHIPVWREMRALRAIQVNDRAADELDQYWNGLRDDQIVYVNPTEYMTVECIMRITNGHRIVIVSDVNDPKQIRKRIMA